MTAARTQTAALSDATGGLPPMGLTGPYRSATLPPTSPTGNYQFATLETFAVSLDFRARRSTAATGGSPTRAETIAQAVARAKDCIRDLARHLSGEQHRTLLAQIDRLHETEDWEAEDQPIRIASLESFLRAMLRLKPGKWPGLGMTHDGYLLANWGSRLDQLNMQFRANDEVHWSLYRARPNAPPELAAGVGVTEDLARVLDPYDPRHWLDAG